MASIANASKVYVAVGGDGTPLKIFDSNNTWTPITNYYVGTGDYQGDITSINFAYKDNGNGTITIIANASGSWGSRSLPLPNGYVLNGSQTLQGGNCADGLSVISIYPYGDGICKTFAVRKSN